MRKLPLLLLAGSLCIARPLVLVKDGRSAYSICLARDASPSEKHAAEELQKFIEEISGARLPIVSDEGRPGGRLLLVGNSRITDRLKLSTPAQKTGPEGFALKTAGKHLLIAGGRQRGTMYGVYALLERLGCRWFAPGLSRIPKMRTIAIGALNEIQKPAFEYREPFFTEAFDRDWAARNKANGNRMELDEPTGGKVQYFPFVHSFYQLIPPQKYFAEHPEYFSLIDGKRRVERGQLCLGNPDVLRLGVEAILKWIEQHPEATIYSVSQNDWEGWCECDNCRRIEQEEGGAHSGPILRFVNALAAEVEKKHPDKLVDTLAYWYSEEPPLKVRPRPNVRIRLCPIGVCEAHPYERCPYNAYFMKNLRAWSKITSQLYIWHYNTNFSHYLMPFPDFDELAADIPMYRRHGVVGLFLEGAYPKGGGGENAELRSYVMARVLWDTQADVNQAIREFLEAAYGKAAQPMHEYFELLHREVRLPPAGQGHHFWIYGVPDFSSGFLSQARDLFQRADAAASDEAVRARLRKARLPIDYLELLRAKQFAVRDGWYAPADPSGLKDRFERFFSDLRRFGITSLHEGVDLGADEREFAVLMKPYRIATIENAALRVDLVPELSGRIIRIIDKKTGQDLLRRPSPGERGYPDLAGLGLFAYPDFHSRTRINIVWELESAPTPDALVLIGNAASGLKLRRTIQLSGNEPLMRTETTVENSSAAPIDIALLSRLETDPAADYQDLAAAFRAQDGSTVEKTLLQREQPPAGSESYTGAHQPDGEWRIIDPRTGSALVSRFPKDHVERCNLSWTAKAQKRVTMDLWSRQHTLKPGERLQLHTHYGVGYRGPIGVSYDE